MNRPQLPRRDFLASCAALSAPWLVPGLALAQNPAAPAAARFGSMGDGMAALSSQLKTALMAAGQTTVALGPFTPAAAGQHTSFGARIVSALSQQLTGSGITAVNGAGAWKLGGEYSGEKNETNGKFEVFILSQLKDHRGRSQGQMLTPIIQDEREALAMLGATAQLPTQISQELAKAGGTVVEARADAIAAAKAQPAVAVTGALIRTAPNSPFAIEVLALNGQPFPPASVSGQAFVEIPKGASYLVRLHNQSPQDVGVALTIDGINTLAFSQNKSFRDLGVWVIAAGGQGTIRGWHDIGNRSLQFTVTDIANTPAAQFGASDQVGVITATFMAAFSTALPPSEIIPGVKSVGTGKGPPIDQPLKEVERAFGAVKEAISVRYAR
jgi:hypothetical protein